MDSRVCGQDGQARVVGPVFAGAPVMFLDELTNAGAMPSLELTMRFAAQRQRLLAHNIANIDTPNFVQQDVSPDAFSRMLDEAIADRRSRTGGMHGALAWKARGAIGKDEQGQLQLKVDRIRTEHVRGPASRSGVLAHDRNNRDLVRLMQSLAETQMAFRAASSLYRAHRDMIHSAIAERVF